MVQIATASRLERAVAVLETLAYCRVKSKNPHLGALLEAKIIDKELGLLEASTAIADIDAQYGEQNGLHPGTT